MSAGRNNISNKKDWCTPPYYANLVGHFFDCKIDLDPCSNAHSLIEAKEKILLPNDGLLADWNNKNIFINPPYGRDKERGTTIYDWIEKASNAENSDILMLIPVATNTSHFKDLIFKKFDYICFLDDTRLKFYNQGKEDKKGAPMACCMVYKSSNIVHFVNNCFKFFNDADCINKFRDTFGESGKCFRIS